MTRFVCEPRSAKTHDATGERHGMLMVVSFFGYYYAPCGQRYAAWKCRCDCGSECVVRSTDMKSGRQSSCGCLQRKIVGERSTKHGHLKNYSKTHEYIAWIAMLSRCIATKGRTARDYRDRGITVCDRWRVSFVDFLNDIGLAPSRKHTLDRYPDNNGNYEPGNVRWATRKEQARNRRGNVMLTHGGETLTVTDWAERMGARPQSLFARIEMGWSHSEIVTIPIRYGQKRSRN